KLLFAQPGSVKELTLSKLYRPSITPRVSKGNNSPCPALVDGTLRLALTSGSRGNFSMSTTPAMRLTILIFLSLSSGIGQTATSRIVGSANMFLSTLDQKEKQSVLFAFDDDKQRARWSNLPTGIVHRAGISLKEMNPAQHSAAMALVSSALSRRGFEKVEQIMVGDEVNKISERNNPLFGKDLYYISILGTPSEK